MSYHLTQLGSQVVLDSERAARTIASLFRRFRGRTVDVAAYLGVSTSTVKRWITLLDRKNLALRDEIEVDRKRRRDA
jgi:DNA-binding MarR family transcriptional regulator